MKIRVNDKTFGEAQWQQAVEGVAEAIEPDGLRDIDVGVLFAWRAPDMHAWRGFLCHGRISHLRGPSHDTPWLALTALIRAHAPAFSARGITLEMEGE